MSIVRQEIEGNHWYQTPIGLLPSVNGILDATGRKPFDNSDPKMKAAAERGTIVHGLMEQYLNQAEFPRSPLTEVPEAVEPFWKGLYKALLEVGKGISLETYIYHPLGYAGTIDGVCWCRGKRRLIELTTRQRYCNRSQAVESKGLQAVAYKFAWDWMYPEAPIDEVLILIASPGKSYQYFLVPEEIEDLSVEWAKRVCEYHKLQKP